MLGRSCGFPKGENIEADSRTACKPETSHIFAISDLADVGWKVENWSCFPQIIWFSLLKQIPLHFSLVRVQVLAEPI
jgi:hypothetical protein